MQGSTAAAIALTTGPLLVPRTGHLARRLAVALAVIVTSGVIASGFALERADTAGGVAAEAGEATRSSAAVERYGRLPMSFEPNAGQTDPSVRYLARGAGYTVFLTESDAVLALAPHAGSSRGTVVRMSTVGGADHPRISGIDRHAGRVNYFMGENSSAWRTDVATYGRVLYGGVYPGIDLVYYGDQRRLEHDFVVRPGADPATIGIRFTGVESLGLATDGDLLLRTTAGTLRQQAPLAYQEIGGRQRRVDSRYVVENGLVRYEVGAYDTGRTLVIDPSVSYSTFLGGESDEAVDAVAVDATGAAYVTGRTGSPDFPTTPGVHDTTHTSDGGYDVFVTKLHPTGSSLVYSTYIGGDGVDEGRGIAVDAAGRAFVTGRSSFEDGSPAFPLTNGSIRAASDFERGFITVLAAAGNALVYSGTFDAPTGNGVAVHRDTGGTTYAYIVGETSADAFPTTSNAYDRCLGIHDPDLDMCSGGPDGFFMKLIPDGSLAVSSQLVYSTFLGGGASPDFMYDDTALAVSVDAAGRAYVAGRTKTTDFPTTPGAYDRSFNGSGSHLIGDGFVAKLDPTLSGAASLVYSTYLGGTGDEVSRAIDVDPSGNAYVVGNTRSTDYPTTLGAHDRTYGGEGDHGIGDAFVTKIGSTGGSLVYSTFLGAGSDESATGIALTSINEAYVTGGTSSTDFPLVGPIVRFHFHLDDVFVARLTASGALGFSSYFGSTGADEANGIAVDGSDAAYVGGHASSDDFPWSNEAFDRACEADTPDDFCSGDGFVMKIAPAAMSDMCPPGTSLIQGSATDSRQVIVKFRRGWDRRERTAALRAEGLERVRELPLVGAEVVRGAGRSAVAVARALDRRADVEYVTLDHIVQPAGYADEAKFKELWGLHNTGQAIRFPDNFGTPDVDIDALEASAITLGDPNLTVAVIDDGVDFSHPDLAGRQWVNPGESGGGKETNGQDDDGNGYVDDVNGWDFVNDDKTVHDAGDSHGTHVAGTIAANLNGIGIVGVAPNVKVMALKFLGPNGGQTSDAIAAIGYAAAKGIRISNNSWGGISCNPALKEAIAAASDMFFVAAAGNGGPDGMRDNNDVGPFYPASYDVSTIVSVAAIDKDGGLGDFSNWGHRNVDVGAPGVEVYSTIPGGGYDWWPGTSMASPHVAGVAALARSVNPSLTTAQLRQLILDTGTSLPSLVDRTTTGRLVNAKAAVDRALELAEDAPTIAIADLSLAEGSPSGTTDFDFAVSLSAAHTQPVTVRYDTAPGTTDPATAGTDYNSVVDGSVTIPAGQTSRTARVVVHRDTSDEPDETFSVSLSNATNATIADAQATGTIVDDDVPPPADDTTAPLVEPPTTSVRDTAIGSKVPVTVAWPAATDDTGIERYQLQQSTAGGSYVNVTLASPTAREVTLNLAPGTMYRFRVRAFDPAGNLSAWATGPSFTVGLSQEDATGLTYTGTWTQATLAGASGGSVRHANSAGATVSHTFIGRGVALVMTEAPNRGIAEVRLDGVLVATLDTYDPATLVRRVLYTRSFATSGTHTLELRVTGTKNALSSSRRVDLDAVVVLQ